MADNDPPRLAQAALGALALGLAAGGSALAAAAGARKIGREEHPPTGAFVDVDGVRLHYVDVGPRDAPVVLFLHGNGACLDDLVVSGLVELCARRWRCVVPDRPGYGHSSRPGGRSYTPNDQAALMSRFVETLGLAQPLVVGHSWGSLIALGMALDPAAPARGAVLMSGYYYPQDRPDVYVMGLPSTPVIGPALIWTLGAPTMRRLGPKMLGRMFAPHPTPDRVGERYPFAFGERPGQITATVAELAVMKQAASDMMTRYSECRVPVSLLHGAEDQAIPAALHTGRLAGEIADAHVALLPGLGHMIHYFAQDVIADAIAATFERAAPPRLHAAGARE